MRIMVRLIGLVLVLLALGLAGCASVEDKPDEAEPAAETEDEPATPEESEEPDDATEESAEDAPDDAAAAEPERDDAGQPEGLSGDTLYRLLVGEIAGSRGDLDTALDAYIDAARETRDPRIAERAARTAMRLERYPEAIEAAERWLQLVPESRRPQSLLAYANLTLGDADRAAVHLRALVEQSEDAQNGLRDVASLAAQVDDAETVIEALEQVLATYPESARLHYTLAFKAADAGQTERAMTGVEEALALDPDYSQALLLRAELLVDQARGEEALELLAEARERMPGNRELALGEIDLLLELGRRDDAIKAMQAAFEQFGDDGQAVNRLAQTALQIGALDDARIYYQRQLAMDGQPDQAHYQLGRIAERQGDCDSAMGHYIQVQGQEYRFEAQRRFALCLAEQGRIDEARMHVQRLHQAHGDDNQRLALERTRGRIELIAGNPEAALRVFNQLVDDHPDNDDLLYDRALMAMETGEEALARDDLEALLERNPEAPQIQNALGYTLADAGEQLERARSLIESALEQMPNSAAVLDSMGWVLYRQGNLEDGIEYLRQAWQRLQDGEIGAHLGELLWQAGERDEARSIWQRAEEVDPGNRVLQDTRERLTE